MVSFALGLAAKFIPGLVSAGLDDAKAGKVASTVLKMAKAYFPDNTDEDALAKYESYVSQNPERLAELQDAVKEIFAMQIKDTQHARLHRPEGPDYLMYILVVFSYAGNAVGLGALVYVTAILKLDGGTLAAVAAAIGGAMTWMQQQVQQIINFRYGSSLGSKLKDK